MTEQDIYEQVLTAWTEEDVTAAEAAEERHDG